MITYNDFKKIDLRVAKILEAERVEESEKLIKLKIEVGTDDSKNPLEKIIKQIVAGIGKNYTPEQLIGKEIVVVNNLEPRSLMGLESQAMLLAASDADGPILLIPEKEVKPGVEIR